MTDPHAPTGHEWGLAGTAHECVFVEEQEPSGRLILPPCIVCGTPAMDALNQLRGPEDGEET